MTPPRPIAITGLSGLTLLEDVSGPRYTAPGVVVFYAQGEAAPRTMALPVGSLVFVIVDPKEAANVRAQLRAKPPRPAATRRRR